MTAVSHASLLSKRKSKRKKNKINIKLEKLNKEKLSVFKAFYNSWTNQLLSVITKFLILFSILFTIEPVFPKKTLVRVYLMITSAVKAFEGVEVCPAWFLTWEGWSYCLLYSTKWSIDGVWICEDHYTWQIWLLGSCMRKLHNPISSSFYIGVHWGSYLYF